MILLAFCAALAAFIYVARRLSTPKHAPIPDMPNPVTQHNVDQALLHISRKYGIEEHHDAHDEAHGPAPDMPPVTRKRGRPRKTPGAEVVTLATPKPAKPGQDVLASGLKIPARIVYDRGHHAGMPRDIVITSVLGNHRNDGAFNIVNIKCVCDTAKQFRCFAVEHIVTLYDGETGELIANPPAWIDRKLALLV
jgi:hypothetical protein